MPIIHLQLMQKTTLATVSTPPGLQIRIPTSQPQPPEGLGIEKPTEPSDIHPHTQGAKLKSKVHISNSFKNSES